MKQFGSKGNIWETGCGKIKEIILAHSWVT
jgi:hypothetical protein